MYLVDYHMHSDFSSDCHTPMADMIAAAVNQGLDEIVFTDHFDLTTEGESFPFEINYEQYVKVLNENLQRYQGKINIRLGIEAGLHPPYNDKIDKFIRQQPFEFVIGSSHYTCSLDHYNGDFFKGKDNKTAFGLYFQEIYENVVSFDNFDVYGHLDYVNRYSSYADNSIRYSEYQEIIDEILKSLVARGKGLEVNTSGFRYGLDRTHPPLDILKRYKELGGEIITLGSDAHFPQHIAEGFDKARDLLREAGFKAFTVFRNRKPEWKDL